MKVVLEVELDVDPGAWESEYGQPDTADDVVTYYTTQLYDTYPVREHIIRSVKVTRRP